MLKILIISCVAFSLFAAEFDNDFPPKPSPLRRSASMGVGVAAYHLKYSSPEEKLITMVSYYKDFGPELHIRQTKIVQFIRQHPLESNPYSDMHNAYLITLAARYGLLEVVQAIAECNPGAIHCFPIREYFGGVIEKETPLDEAVLFGQKEVAKFLYHQDASLKKVSQEQLDALLVPSKKRKRNQRDS